jgi:hypothetical protein
MFRSFDSARVSTAATVTRKLRANCTRWSRTHCRVIEMRLLRRALPELGCAIAAAACGIARGTRPVSLLAAGINTRM